MAVEANGWLEMGIVEGSMMRDQHRGEEGLVGCREQKACANAKVDKMAPAGSVCEAYISLSSGREDRQSRCARQATACS